VTGYQVHDPEGKTIFPFDRAQSLTVPMKNALKILDAAQVLC